MVYLIIVVLTIAVLYLLVRLLSLKKALKGAGKQLKEINRELEENRIVKLTVPDKDAEELLMVMNESLQAIREHKNMYAKREKELKQQIERILLRNRISYYIKWHKQGLFKRNKDVCVFCINDNSKEEAEELVRSLSENIEDSVRFLLRKTGESYF